ncbi:UNVERIFIED_CONTAM: UDP-glycosyltransferase 89B2 [Sesamum radiatum]|uniref:UDP-glycosyltransferase 89B2 n=1 Tax=Sesamum radiatum TaxID=300843 RepID=A0AAW2TGR9_SESRA
MFVGWTHHLARQLGIRRYAFFPSGAFAISFVYSLWREMPQRKNYSDDNEMVGFPRIPNSPFYPWWQLSPIFRRYVKGDPKMEFIRDSFLANGSSYGSVFNSFGGLEGAHLDYLKKELGHNRVWAIGPVLPPDDVGPNERGGSSSTSISDIRSWLDTCQDHSVVYVCFGSQAVLTNKQMNELALGLEKSGVKFILAVKGATKGHVEEDYGAIR